VTTSGQPPRGTTITGLQFRNNLVRRNVFVRDGKVFILQGWDKNVWRKETMDDLIIRFLLPEVAERMVQYLIYFQPIEMCHSTFSSYFSRYILKNRFSCTPTFLLFHNQTRALTESGVLAAIARKFKLFFKCSRMGLSGYR
jgi:hypothetical protein